MIKILIILFNFAHGTNEYIKLRKKPPGNLEQLFGGMGDEQQEEIIIDQKLVIKSQELSMVELPDYTVMLWFRPIKEEVTVPDGFQEEQTLFTLEGQMSCFLKNRIVYCRNVNGQTLQVEIDKLVPIYENWMHLTLASSSRNVSYLQLDMIQYSIGAQQQDMKFNLNWVNQARIGRAFNGDVHSFLFTAEFLAQDKVQFAKNNEQIWSSLIWTYHIFNNEELLDYLGENPARLASKGIPAITREALPKFVCEQFLKDIELPRALTLQNSNLKLKAIPKPEQDYTFETQFKASEQKGEATLFNLIGVFSILFNDSFLLVNNSNGSLFRLPIPRDQWINLVLRFNSQGTLILNLYNQAGILQSSRSSPFIHPALFSGDYSMMEGVTGFVRQISLEQGEEALLKYDFERKFESLGFCTDEKICERLQIEGEVKYEYQESFGKGGLNSNLTNFDGYQCKSIDRYYNIRNYSEVVKFDQELSIQFWLYQKYDAEIAIEFSNFTTLRLNRSQISFMDRLIDLSDDDWQFVALQVDMRTQKYAQIITNEQIVELDISAITDRTVRMTVSQGVLRELKIQDRVSKLYQIYRSRHVQIDEQQSSLQVYQKFNEKVDQLEEVKVSSNLKLCSPFTYYDGSKCQKLGMNFEPYRLEGLIHNHQANLEFVDHVMPNLKVRIGEMAYSNNQTLNVSNQESQVSYFDPSSQYFSLESIQDIDYKCFKITSSFDKTTKPIIFIEDQQVLSLKLFIEQKQGCDSGLYLDSNLTQDSNLEVTMTEDAPNDLAFHEKLDSFKSFSLQIKVKNPSAYDKNLKAIFSAFWQNEQAQYAIVLRLNSQIDPSVRLINRYENNQIQEIQELGDQRIVKQVHQGVSMIGDELVIDASRTRFDQKAYGGVFTYVSCQGFQCPKNQEFITSINTTIIADYSFDDDPHLGESLNFLQKHQIPLIRETYIHLNFRNAASQSSRSIEGTLPVPYLNIRRPEIEVIFPDKIASGVKNIMTIKFKDYPEDVGQFQIESSFQITSNQRNSQLIIEILQPGMHEISIKGYLTINSFTIEAQLTKKPEVYNLKTLAFETQFSDHSQVEKLLTLKVPAEQEELFFSLQVEGPRWIELQSGRTQNVSQNFLIKVPRLSKNMHIKVFDKNGGYYFQNITLPDEEQIENLNFTTNYELIQSGLKDQKLRFIQNFLLQNQNDTIPKEILQPLQYQLYFSQLLTLLNQNFTDDLIPEFSKTQNSYDQNAVHIDYLSLLEKNMSRLSSFKEKYIDQIPEKDLTFKSDKIILQKSLKVFENQIDPFDNKTNWETRVFVEQDTLEQTFETILILDSSLFIKSNYSKEFEQSFREPLVYSMSRGDIEINFTLPFDAHKNENSSFFDYGCQTYSLSKQTFTMGGCETKNFFFDAWKVQCKCRQLNFFDTLIGVSRKTLLSFRNGEADKKSFQDQLMDQIMDKWLQIQHSQPQNLVIVCILAFFAIVAPPVLFCFDFKIENRKLKDVETFKQINWMLMKSLHPFLGLMYLNDKQLGKAMRSLILAAKLSLVCLIQYWFQTVKLDETAYQWYIQYKMSTQVPRPINLIENLSKELNHTLSSANLLDQKSQSFDIEPFKVQVVGSLSLILSLITFDLPRCFSHLCQYTIKDGKYVSNSFLKVPLTLILLAFVVISSNFIIQNEEHLPYYLVSILITLIFAFVILHPIYILLWTLIAYYELHYNLNPYDFMQVEKKISRRLLQLLHCMFCCCRFKRADGKLKKSCCRNILVPWPVQELIEDHILEEIGHQDSIKQKKTMTQPPMQPAQVSDASICSKKLEDKLEERDKIYKLNMSKSSSSPASGKSSSSESSQSQSQIQNSSQQSHKHMVQENFTMADLVKQELHDKTKEVMEQIEVLEFSESQDGDDEEEKVEVRNSQDLSSSIDDEPAQTSRLDRVQRNKNNIEMIDYSNTINSLKSTRRRNPDRQMRSKYE